MSHVTTEASATTETASPLLAIQNLTVRYGLATAVRNLDLSVNEGHALALLGVNGSWEKYRRPRSERSGAGRRRTNPLSGTRHHRLARP